MDEYQNKHIPNGSQDSSIREKESSDPTAAGRKNDHIALAQQSAIASAALDDRFHYEPLLSAHPSASQSLAQNFLGKKISAPIWISSMTGGSERAYSLNRVLAKMANTFGLGMGLGSCRCLMENSDRFEDFNLREILGDDLPFFANIGIAQLETLVGDKKTREFFLSQLSALQVDGLIIHVNPLQEWLQPEGDRFSMTPLETIKRFIDLMGEMKIVVKEVGQGFGPRSMQELVNLPISGIEFAAFGGTNFSRLEMLRGKGSNHQDPLSYVGHHVEEMIRFFNTCTSGNTEKDIIISGGVSNFLDGHFYQQTLKANSVIGMAGAVLKYALEGEDSLHHFMQQQIEGFKFASQFLTVKKEREL